MKALVTGAAGFVGRAVVAALLGRGHSVRAMVRPATSLKGLAWQNDVEVFRADLRNHTNLAEAFEGVDVLMHLAAVVAGSDEARFAGTAVATERLLDAMRHTRTDRLVLASTLSVYDWSRFRKRLDEDVPLESNLYLRDGYAIAKTWQERLVRRAASEHQWHLTVLRPGFVWGPGSEWVTGAGFRVGRFVLVNGPLRRLPLTHVDNCAECFALAAERPGAVGRTLNVVDDDDIRAWRFCGDFLERRRRGGVRIPIPYASTLAAAYCATWAARLLFGPDARLPGALIPARHRARFGSKRFPNQRVRSAIGWTPSSYEQCLERTYDTSDRRPAIGSVHGPNAVSRG